MRIDHVIRSHCGSSLWQASVRRNEACVRYYRRRRGQMIRGLRHFGAAWNSLRGLLFRRDFGDFSAGSAWRIPGWMCSPRGACLYVRRTAAKIPWIQSGSATLEGVGTLIWTKCPGQGKRAGRSVQRAPCRFRSTPAEPRTVCWRTPSPRTSPRARALVAPFRYSLY